MVRIRSVRLTKIPSLHGARKAKAVITGNTMLWRPPGSFAFSPKKRGHPWGKDGPIPIMVDWLVEQVEVVRAVVDKIDSVGTGNQAEQGACSAR